MLQNDFLLKLAWQKWRFFFCLFLIHVCFIDSFCIFFFSHQSDSKMKWRKQCCFFFFWLFFYGVLCHFGSTINVKQFLHLLRMIDADINVMLLWEFDVDVTPHSVDKLFSFLFLSTQQQNWRQKRKEKKLIPEKKIFIAVCSFE